MNNEERIAFYHECCENIELGECVNPYCEWSDEYDIWEEAYSDCGDW